VPSACGLPLFLGRLPLLLLLAPTLRLSAPFGCKAKLHSNSHFVWTTTWFQQKIVYLRCSASVGILIDAGLCHIIFVHLAAEQLQLPAAAAAVAGLAAVGDAAHSSLKLHGS